MSPDPRITVDRTVHPQCPRDSPDTIYGPLRLRREIPTSVIDPFSELTPDSLTWFLRPLFFPWTLFPHTFSPRDYLPATRRFFLLHSYGRRSVLPPSPPSWHTPRLTTPLSCHLRVPGRLEPTVVGRHMSPREVLGTSRDSRLCCLPFL